MSPTVDEILTVMYDFFTKPLIATFLYCDILIIGSQIVFVSTWSAHQSVLPNIYVSFSRSFIL